MTLHKMTDAENVMNLQLQHFGSDLAIIWQTSRSDSLVMQKSGFESRITLD